MVAKVKLEFKLLSTKKIPGGHLLTLNIENRGTSILKNLVVRLHSADPRVSTDHTGCFVYALMPSSNEKVKFEVCLVSLARAYFSVTGYSSGDAYFSMKSRKMNAQTINSMENSMLLM